MRRRLLAGWGASLQELSGAFGELVRAELAALGDDLSRNGRRLGGALLLLAGALFVLFWATALSLYLAVEVAVRWLPRWGAVASVLGLALLIVLILAAIARHRLRGLEKPTELVRRRWASHRDWWLDQFPAAKGRPGVEPSGPRDPDAG